MTSSGRVRRSENGTEGPVVWPPGWHVEHVESTGSTNADLLLAAESGAPDRSVLFTDHQTAGRGRLDRVWSAPPGSNLLVSLLFRNAPDDPGELTRRVGLAAVGAAAEIAGVAAVLKWPNDVLVDERKLAGILAQRTQGGTVVIGLGMNVGWSPDGAARLGDGISPHQVLESLLRSFDRLPADIEPAYRSALDTIGRRVRIELPVGELVGTAIDIETDGRLVVLDECAVTHRVSVGDIVHLRPT